MKIKKGVLKNNNNNCFSYKFILNIFLYKLFRIHIFLNNLSGAKAGYHYLFSLTRLQKSLNIYSILIISCCYFVLCIIFLSYSKYL